MTTIDGNEATARIAYALSDVIAIYPITPSSSMAEAADAWAAEGKANIWGAPPTVVEMQSEAGAAGAVHGALQTGARATTFTASQGLLLMIPNMYKIAGELTPAVFHVAARALAAQGLSIFGDHSDVMATRATGWAQLCAASVQEAQDLALVAHAATLKARIPFIHFFDGFRTSAEVNKIELLDEADLRAMIDQEAVTAHRLRGLSPDRPVLRGTAQNPDVYFQGRETVNTYYNACPAIVQAAMDRFAAVAGRHYHLFDYHGAPDAEEVIVMMGSGAETAQETADYLNAHGEKVGVVKVRLFRPFDARAFAEAVPPTVKSIAVLDRTKEPGSAGEPLYLDCVTAMHEAIGNGWREQAAYPQIVGGRYGLASKEFTPAMVRAIFANLKQPRPKNHFTVGINDDVSGTSLEYDPGFSIEPESVVRALFYGLGSDGTVGANKNSIKIIGEQTDNYAQGYFVYDSKKAGTLTTSHLRFGPEPIHAPYLVRDAHFVACHQPMFLDRYDVLEYIRPGGTFLLNTPYGPAEVWEHLPPRVRRQIAGKGLRLYVIDAQKVARECGMGRRINTVMQSCFFAISGVLPREKAIAEIKKSIQKSYGKKGDEVVAMNIAAVDQTLDNLHEVPVPTYSENGNGAAAGIPRSAALEGAPLFVRDVLGAMIAGHGDLLPVSALPADGTYPTGTTQYERRNLAPEIPVWDPDICIQCGKCTLVCPHASIRIKTYDPKYLDGAPAGFQAADARDREWAGLKYSIQVAPEDCTGCSLCAAVCPVKNKRETRLKALNMRPQEELVAQERTNWDFFRAIPELDRRNIKVSTIREQQAQQPLFEFSGACSGCGETPYLKLLTQLFGDRVVVANATGCSSIYGGNLPTTPWAHNAEGRGPAWSNSLFEDNAEFGLGFRLSLDKQYESAADLLRGLQGAVGESLTAALLTAPQHDEAAIYDQRERIALLKQKLAAIGTPEANQLLAQADMLVKKSVWIVGGDGWAYDIGFGGLDHVIASGQRVRILVLDTEVYSNTGGQASKSTPRGAVAKFAAGGKRQGKKDLGMIAMSYGNAYVAAVALGAKDEQTLKVFLEAEAYDGPALIIAYSHCIEHGIEMAQALDYHKAAVDSGAWLLYHYNPDLVRQGHNPLMLDSRAPRIPVRDYMALENRFNVLTKTRPEEADLLAAALQHDVDARWSLYEYLAARPYSASQAQPAPQAPTGATANGH